MAAGEGRVHLLSTGGLKWWDEGVDDRWVPVPPQVLTLNDAGGFVSRWGGAGEEDGRFEVRTTGGAS